MWFYCYIDILFALTRSVSQVFVAKTKFVAIILVLSVFFMRFFTWPIFRLARLTFRPQTRDKPVAHRVH